jgi:hypothetical protein
VALEALISRRQASQPNELTLDRHTGGEPREKGGCRADAALPPQALQRRGALDLVFTAKKLNVARQDVLNADVERQGEELLCREGPPRSVLVLDHDPIENHGRNQGRAAPKTAARVLPTMASTSSMRFRSMPSSCRASSRLLATASKCASLSPFFLTKSA